MAIVATSRASFTTAASIGFGRRSVTEVDETHGSATTLRSDVREGE